MLLGVPRNSGSDLARLYLLAGLPVSAPVQTLIRSFSTGVALAAIGDRIRVCSRVRVQVR
jgi:hypothetical protein